MSSHDRWRSHKGDRNCREIVDKLTFIMFFYLVFCNQPTNRINITKSFSIASLHKIKNIPFVQSYKCFLNNKKTMKKYFVHL